MTFHVAHGGGKGGNDALWILGSLREFKRQFAPRFISLEISQALSEVQTIVSDPTINRGQTSY